MWLCGWGPRVALGIVRGVGAGCWSHDPASVSRGSCLFRLSSLQGRGREAGRRGRPTVPAHHTDPWWKDPRAGPRSWFQGSWPPSRLLWGSVHWTPALSDSSLHFDECQTQERAAGKVQRLPACPSLQSPNVDAHGLRFFSSPLAPSLPPSLPPSLCVCLTLTHIHTRVHTSLCSLCRPRLCASWLCFRKDPGGMQGGLGRGRLPPELPARGRRPGRGTPGCSEGCREPTVSYRILSTDVRALSRSKAVQGPFFRLLAVTEITVEGSEVAQWRPPLRPPGRSPPGSSVHGILQASILEWVAISFSRGSSRSRDWTMKLMSDLTDSATLSSHPACDNPEFREEQMGHFRSPTAGGTGWGPNAGCPALASPPGTAPAAMPRTPPQLHSTSTSSGLGVGDVCFAHLQGTEVGGWLGHPRLQRPRSPDLPRPAPWLRGRGSVSTAATRPPRQGLVTTPPHSVAEKADFANLLFKSREVTKIKQKRRETGLGRGKGGSQK